MFRLSKELLFLMMNNGTVLWNNFMSGKLSPQVLLFQGEGKIT